MGVQKNPPHKHIDKGTEKGIVNPHHKELKEREVEKFIKTVPRLNKEQLNKSKAEYKMNDTWNKKTEDKVHQEPKRKKKRHKKQTIVNMNNKARSNNRATTINLKHKMQQWVSIIILFT